MFITVFSAHCSRRVLSTVDLQQPSMKPSARLGLLKPAYHSYPPHLWYNHRATPPPAAVALPFPTGRDLQRRLCAGGQLVSMQAYANNTTLLRHDMEKGELEEMVEEVMEDMQEELRCPLCGQ